eukprot:13020-Heterococcus_DN1.PRE.1
MHIYFRVVSQSMKTLALLLSLSLIPVVFSAAEGSWKHKAARYSGAVARGAKVSVGCAWKGAVTASRNIGEVYYPHREPA